MVDKVIRASLPDLDCFHFSVSASARHSTWCMGMAEGGPGGPPTAPILSPLFEEKLMAFQKDGVRFGLRTNGRCLIGDEVGTHYISDKLAKSPLVKVWLSVDAVFLTYTGCRWA